MAKSSANAIKEAWRKLKNNPADPYYFRTRVPDYVPSHAQRVKALYKTACRTIEDNTHGTIRGSWICKTAYIYFAETEMELESRLQMRRVRKMFDDAKCIEDPFEARKMLLAGEYRVFTNRTPLINRFPTAPGGVEFKRYPYIPDWVIDTLTPEEKAAYPEYFARREVRKKEFMDRWLETYGKDAINKSL